MSQQDRRSRPADLRRRGFLLTVGTGGVATAAVALKPVTATATETVDVGASSQGYRETAHVRDYYRTTKI
jgi:hypothetical protein